MEDNDAFRILNLDMDSATEKDVQEKFKELAKDNHPDKGGTNSEMSEITVARKTAIEYIKNKKLVTYADLKSITENVSNQIVNASIQQENYKKLKDTILIKNVSPLKRQQHMIKTTGSLFGVMTFVTSDIYPILEDYISVPNSLKITLLMITLLSGMVYLHISSNIQRIEQFINYLDDTFSDKNKYMDLFKRIYNIYDIKGAKKTEFTVEETTRALMNIDDYRLLNHSVISLNEFSQLFLSKGVKQQILFEKEIIMSGVLVSQYSLAPQYEPLIDHGD